jgi:hypothetical protein
MQSERHGCIVARVGHLPAARNTDLLIEPVGDELVVLDCASNEAHALDARAAALWRACDGQRSVAELARDCSLPETVVDDTLQRLADCDLLMPVEAVSDGVSRRVVVRRLALAGAGVGFGLPLIASVAVRPASAAASVVVEPPDPGVPPDVVTPGPEPPTTPPANIPGLAESTASTVTTSTTTTPRVKAASTTKKPKKKRARRARRRRRPKTIRPRFTG